jgi:type I restriction enzyme S subunit
MKPHLSFYEKTKVGTTVIHLGKGDLDFIETVIPDKESLLKFKTLSTPIEEKIINNQQEIQSLTKTRDTLLPKLMSGQVRVKNLKQTSDA